MTIPTVGPSARLQALARDQLPAPAMASAMVTVIALAIPDTVALIALS